MSQSVIDRKFYESIVNFEKSVQAQDHFYEVMDKPSGKKAPDGHETTVREQILKVYGALFCEDTGLADGAVAGVDDVIDTADRLYIDSAGYDREHWYRMKHHFPVIDEDNYDRFAALVISDLRCGPLHDAAVSDGKTLVIGEADPLHMSAQQRRNQHLRTVSLHQPGEGEQ